MREEGRNEGGSEAGRIGYRRNRWRKRARPRGRDRYVSQYTDLLPLYLQSLELGKAEARDLRLYPSLFLGGQEDSVWTIICYLLEAEV